MSLLLSPASLQVYASDIQIARTNGVHMRLDELGFTCSLRASEAAAEAAVARKARAEEEAKQRLAAAAAHESRVIVSWETGGNVMH